jgi:hypothetical protein
MVARALGRLTARLLDPNRPGLRDRASEFGQRLRSEYEAGKHGEPELDDAAVDDIAARMRGVDWAAVRAASAEKGSDAAEAMRSMAQKVDWDKVQPVAAKVSSALIAAVATGQLPIGGTSGRVARAILNDQRFADRIGDRLQADHAETPDFRSNVIETTARD